MVKLLIAIIPAVLAIAIAILSVQNATLVPITFLTLTTISLPVGIWLAFALGLGMVGTALLLSLFGRKTKSL
ncbi:MAG: lipopolysaccharide assembly protein LapA domain-containing protein [Cyanobacteria bacterium J06623_4]